VSLFLCALWQIFRFEVYLRCGTFSVLYRRVRTNYLRQVENPHRAVEEICAAIDLVCIWYPKQVLCLQRSAATTCLLRSYGIPAQMVLGAQQMPFKSHAWVEVDRRVVNDKPYAPEIYAELDRC
jgi:transglutaminase superfamily protein